MKNTELSWSEFKRRVEAQGVKDDTGIVRINWVADHTFGTSPRIVWNDPDEYTQVLIENEDY